MNEQKFKVGDWVSAFGLEGRVKRYDYNQVEVRLYPNKDRTLAPIVATFFTDGRYETWHLEPSLKLIERPKRTVKRTMWHRIYGTPGRSLHYGTFLFDTKEEALAGNPCYSQLCGVAPVEVEMLEEGDYEPGKL